MYNLTLKGQGHNLTSDQVRARSLGDPSRSNYTSFDAPCGVKRDETNPTSLSHWDLKLLAKKLLVTSSDLHDLNRGHRLKISLGVSTSILPDAIPFI